MRRRPNRREICAGLAGAFLLSPSAARAEPLRLRADAVAETQSPAGLVVLQGSDRARPWMDAETLVWAGARTDPTADVLVLTLRLRDPRGRGEVRGGRFVFATGAIRPVQVDGASALGRAAWGGTLEAMAGVPVVPRFGTRAYDWIVAGRVAQSVGERAPVKAGVSYVQRRAHGEIADEELGADVAAVPLRWLDLAARGAYDLTSPGIADALVSVAARKGDVRVEGFATHRSPSRLIPATSLFSVLGDVPSDMIGSTVRWNAAPRLDVWATGAGQRIGFDYGGNASVRALLRLDDTGRGTLGVELRRQSVSAARWSGVRMVASHPLGGHLRVSSEIEVAVPDEARGRGSVWPWGLLALAWRSRDGWEAASGVEAASTPEHRFEVNALVRLSRVVVLP
jgi:hypothetical protein